MDDIKNQTASFYSVQLKIPKTKLEVIPPKDVEGDTLSVKTTSSWQIFPKELAKIFLKSSLKRQLLLNQGLLFFYLAFLRSVFPGFWIDLHKYLIVIQHE